MLVVTAIVLYFVCAPKEKRIPFLFSQKIVYTEGNKQLY